MILKGTFYTLITLLLLTSCVNVTAQPSVSNQPGAGNKEEYATPISTLRPEVFPVKDEENKVVMLLRSREQPFEMLVISLSNDCLVGRANCDENNTVLAKLPENLSQVLSLSWTDEGNKAFFWDGNIGDIYALDVNEGTSSIFKKEVWKIRDGFLLSPLGDQMIFEVQKGSNESDLVAMDINSGEIITLDIPLSCMKFVRAWLNPESFMFWCEKYTGDKGYLESIEIYVYDFTNKTIQPFDIGYDWMQASIPLISPDKNYMAFTTDDKTIIRDISNASESILDVRSEKLLWSSDSKMLAIYDQSKEIYSMLSNEGKFQQIFSLSTTGDLEDWIWLSDNNNILLIVVDNDGNRNVGVLSVVNRTFTPLNLSLLDQYDAISLSFRP